MVNNKILQIIGNLECLKNELIGLNDNLSLNMKTDTYKIFSAFLFEKIKEINTLIEKLDKMNKLVSEYTNLTAINKNF